MQYKLYINLFACYFKVENKSRQIEADIENLDTFRNDDTPVQVIKQEMPRPGMLETNKCLTCV